MSYKRCYQFLIVPLAIMLFVATGNTQSLVPPQATGPQTLSGFTEFFEQAESNFGDIGGITAGPTYWVYVWGITTSGIPRPSGGIIEFNLADAELGSSFKHLGIGFELVNGSDRVWCYQSSGDAESSSDFSPGTLTADPFDLRFMFTKQNPTDEWSVTPEYRLNGGNWTLFDDGVLQIPDDRDFEFLGAKLTVAVPTGSVSFDNFFVVGPIVDFTGIFVDDDWQGLEEGDIVQFPGQFNVQVFGENAFSTIQDGIDRVVNEFFPVSPLAGNKLNAIAGDPPLATVNVAAGEYSENIVIPVPLILDGAGSDSEGGTVIISDSEGSTPVVLISSGGFDGDSRLTVRDVRVTGALSGGNGIAVEANIGSNIASSDGGTPQLNSIVLPGVAHITFENVAAVGNDGNGIAINSGAVGDIEVTDCDLSNNDNSGFRISNNINYFNGLTMDGCQINENGINGLSTGSIGSLVVNNIHVSNSSFSENGDALSESGAGSGDISLFQFNGNASLTNVLIHGDGSHIGLQIRGDDLDGEDPGILSPAGTVELDSVIISGTYQHPDTWVGSGIYITGYSDISSISFNDVEIDVTPAPESTPVINLNLENVFGAVDVGNTTFGGNASADILNNSAINVDATGAVFTNAEDNFEIEDRVIHAIDLEVISSNIIQQKTKGALLPQINQIEEFSFGLVRWVPNHLFMTVNSFAPNLTFFPSIQRAINAASEGNTLNIAPGVYFEAPTIHIFNNLTIIGSGPEETIFVANGGTDTMEEYGNPAWFEIGECADVHIHDIAFDGGENSIYYAFFHGGSGSFNHVSFDNIQYDSYEGTAIFIEGCEGPVHVSNCSFTNIGRVGVWYDDSDVNGSVYKNNSYTGKGGNGEEIDYLDFAVVVGGGAHVTIDSSSVTGNHGVSINNGSELSAGYLVRHNGTNVTIKNSEIFNNLHGIRLEGDEGGSPTAIITNNEIDNCDTGVEVQSALFVRLQQNDLTNNSTGANLNDILTTFDVDLNSILFNSSYGVRITSADGEVKDNIISGNGTGVKIREGAAGTEINGNEFCDNESFGVRNVAGSAVDATDNWWGDPSGPDGEGNGVGDVITEDVNFEPFKIESIFPESPCSSGCLSSEVQGNGDVNGDGVITVGDALCAFNIFINGGLPDGCDAANYQCETIAANVDCGPSVTPGDALAIFQRFLDQDPPANCFAGEGSPLAKSAGIYSLSFAKSGLIENKQIKIALHVDNPLALSAFGLEVSYPAAALNYLGVERATLTSDWTQLDAALLEDGKLRIGGFHVQPVASSSAGEVFRLIFEMKSEAVDLNQLAMSEFVDDLSNAVIAAPSADVITAVPMTFALHQNFPNPFNPDTRISFDIPKISGDAVLVTLNIYNITGQLVRTVLNENRAPGTHSVTWDGKTDLGQPVSSGTYFYTISAGSFHARKKMTFLK
jgi:hypothetical protein